MVINDVEKQIAELCHRQHALLTHSGSMALITALKSAKLEQQGKIIMPASCCPAVLFAIQLAGYDVVLADVSLSSLSMEVEHVNAVFNSEVVAVVAVHGYGHYCDIEQLANFCQRKNILLIEDACLAYGGHFNSKPLGSFGDISIVSFGYDKPINLGYGGAILTNSPHYSDNAKLFLQHNQMAQFQQENQLEQLQAELQKLPHYVAQRKRNIQFLEQKICNDAFQKSSNLGDVVYWRYPLLIEQRNDFLAYAKKCGVLFTSHYKNLGDLQTNSNLVNAAFIGAHMINLFVRYQTKQVELDAMVKCINEYQPI